MKTINDGGPAFPCQGFTANASGSLDGQVVHAAGMSLRDRFAIEAMDTIYGRTIEKVETLISGMLAAAGVKSLEDLSAIGESEEIKAVYIQAFDGASEMCYQMADAMLKARGAVRA